MSPTERLLSPDVNRGFMLLFIAVANLTAGWTLLSPLASTTSGRSLADAAVTMFNATFVHARSLPMFATLFGYGIGMLMAREYQRGTPYDAMRNLLLRRYGWLIAIGAVHAVFLFFGDILLPYGMLGVIIALLFLQIKERSVKIFFWVMFSVFLVLGIVTAAAMLWLYSFAPDTTTVWNLPTFLTHSYFGYLLVGLVAALSNVLGGFVSQFLLIGPVMLVGFVAGRAGILSDAEANAALLRKVAIGGFAISITGGLACGALSLILPASWYYAPMLLSLATGMPGGLAMVAAVALWLRPLQAKVRAAAARGETVKLPLVVEMLQALGKRSLSGYLFQSVAFIILLPPFSLDLLSKLGVATGSLLALAVWLVSLVGALLLERAGIQGPAEKLHRRLAYGRRVESPAGP